MCAIFLSAIALGITALALQEAQKAREIARQSQVVEIRYVRVKDTELPKLPDFMQPKKLSLFPTEVQHHDN